MSEQTDLLPLRSPEEGGPAFELVRRGYDREQVENHLGWLEDQLRNAEIARDAAEHAAASAAAEAESAREALESGRPQWHELGERVTQILDLAEEQGAEIRAQRLEQADLLLAEAQETHAEADRIHAARIRDADEQAERILTTSQAKAEQLVSSAQAQAEQTVSSAQAQAEKTVTTAQAQAEQTVSHAQSEADRILVRAQQQAAEEERVASRKLADLERQRDAVNAQLTRLHEALAQALSPAILVQDTPAPEPVAPPTVSVADEPVYEDELPSFDDDGEYAASAKPARRASS